MAGQIAFAKSDPGAELFDSPKLRKFKITIGPEQYQALKDNNRKYVHGIAG